VSKYIVEMNDNEVCDYSFYSENLNVIGDMGRHICLRSDRAQDCEGNLKNRPEWCDLEKLAGYPTKIQNHPFIIGEEL